jgi:hypothetical protein
VLVLERASSTSASEPAEARPRPPSSGRRSGGRRCGTTRPLDDGARAAPRARRRCARLAPGRPCARRGGTSRTSWNSGRANRSPSDAEEPGERGHEHRAAAEVLREPARVHRPGAAVGDEDEVAGSLPLLRRDRAQGARIRAFGGRSRARRAGGFGHRERQRPGDRLEGTVGELGRDREGAEASPRWGCSRGARSLSVTVGSSPPRP